MLSQHVFANQARELQRICYRNHFHMSWILKKLSIDRATFYRWLNELQRPKPRSQQKLEQGITFFQKLEHAIGQGFRPLG